MTIDDVFEQAYPVARSAKEIDDFVQCFAPNFLNEITFIKIYFKEWEKLLKMAEDADKKIVFPGARENLAFAAFYDGTTKFPFPRIYYILEKEVLRVSKLHEYLEEYGHKFIYLSGIEFDDILPSESPNEMIAKYQESRYDSLPEEFKRIIKGRKLYTNLENVVIINSDTCPICDNKETLAVTTTIVGSSSTCCLYRLCTDCLSIAHKEGITGLDSIGKKHGIPVSFSYEDYSYESIKEDVIELIKKELQASSISINDSRKEIKAKKESGFTIIFRLTSPTDYAYIILDSNGKEVGKFDCADHHEVDGGPAHLHYDKSKKRYKKVVQPSWFIGCPLFDMKGLKAFIELIEKQC